MTSLSLDYNSFVICSIWKSGVWWRLRFLYRI